MRVVPGYAGSRGDAMKSSIVEMTQAKPCEVECIAKGNPYEMGLAQGESLREKIRSATQVLDRLEAFRLAQPSWLPYSIFRRVCEMRASRFLQEPLRRDFPDALQRMTGIAEGSGLSLRLIFLMHAIEPMLADVRRCAVMPGIGACSAVALRGTRSATGEPIIARNFDYLPLVQPTCFVRDSRPASGFRSLDFTVAPFAGTFDGVNDKGLCITYDYAYVRDFEKTATAPISITVAEALERCSTVVEAEALFSSRPRWGGAILMFADAGGDIASMELSNTRVEVRRPRTGEDVIFHSNTFFTDTMKNVEMPSEIRFSDKAPASLRGRSIHQSASVRDRRFQELLKDSGPLDANQLQMVMADHENIDTPGGTSICTHSDYWNTTASVQLFPRSRRMRIALASACTAKYNEHTL